MLFRSAPDKYELIHFANSARPDLNESIKFGNVTCKPKSEVRVLGVQIDTKLSWKTVSKLGQWME